MQFLKKILGIKTAAEKRLLEENLTKMKRDLRDKVTGLAKPALHLIKTSNKTNSKFGGNPIVDNHAFVWPTVNNRPLSFLAQFDLSEIAKQFKFSWLRESGSVLFFYDLEEMPWGFDPKDKPKWKVIYQVSPSIQIDFPGNLSTEFIVKESYIDFHKITVLPSCEDQHVRNLHLSDKEIDLYFELGDHFDEFNSYKGLPAHQVGGFPQPIQGDEMQFESQQASNGIYMGDAKAYENASTKEFESAKHQWQLLFQFDSDDKLGVMWGDVGMLYFWVKKDRSEQNDFDDVWLILQCH